MPLTLSSADLDAVSQAMRLLVSPFAYDSIDAWRSAVNRHLRELLYADSAGFLLPIADGLALYSDEHSPEDMARYPDLTPPSLADGTPVWKRGLELEVTTLEQVYGQDLDRYLQSPYYNEFAAPGKAHFPVAMAYLLDEAEFSSLTCLQFWHSRPGGRRFGDREVALLRLLFPAFQAGVASVLRWRAQRDNLLHMLDSFGQPALIGNRAGRVVHVTPSLETVLEADPERARLRTVLRAMLRDVCSTAGVGTYHRDAWPVRLDRNVRTRTAEYDARGFLYGGPPMDDTVFAVVVLERKEGALPSLEVLRERFGLTRRQAEVALLLARRRTNAEIAATLAISPHTARHHTEAVLDKLGAADRRDVGSKCQGTAPAR